tara:strand:+ start:13158 stop:14153 length:996 start_codon:yes stop_codon:yes gene_type:complete
MAQSSWPFENVDTSETQFSQWARNIGEGVKPNALNELEAFADSTGMQVKVKSGQLMIRGHYYQNTSQETLVLTAADLSNPRIDTVLVELDPSANAIILRTVPGSPAVAPTPTPLVQTDAGVYQIKIAEVLVNTGAITISAGAVSDFRTYLGAFEGTVPGSAVVGEITVATIDGDRLLNNIDTATISSANVTDLNVASISDLTASAVELNYSNGVTSSIQDQFNSPKASFVTDATTARTLTSADSGKTIRFTSGSDTVVTVDASTDLAIGERVDIIADGLGVLTVAASTATIAAAEVSTTTGSFTIGLQYSAVTLLCVATDEYRLIGNVAVV